MLLLLLLLLLFSFYFLILRPSHFNIKVSPRYYYIISINYSNIFLGNKLSIYIFLEKKYIIIEYYHIL